ncbi:MAG: hypothetical protein DA330_07715 [Nitrososphaera sp.]|nr:hypothetical protein [Nitrososphaera sp.]
MAGFDNLVAREGLLDRGIYAVIWPDLLGPEALVEFSVFAAPHFHRLAVALQQYWLIGGAVISGDKSRRLITGLLGKITDHRF